MARRDQNQGVLSQDTAQLTFSDPGREYAGMVDGMWVIFDPLIGWHPTAAQDFSAWHAARRRANADTE